MEKGKLELDVCVNPFESIQYGQNWVFFHYGLGNGYELHGYQSKWGTLYNWNDSTYESYLGMLKQWASYEYIDLATSVGIRKVLRPEANPSLIGPGILYTLKINKKFRIGGHLQYIGEITPNEIRNYNLGYTWETGLYYFISQSTELAFGVFTNSTGDIRPIYTLNFYF